MIIIANLFKVSVLNETINNFVCSHLQNDFCHENNFNEMLETFLFYLALVLILLLLVFATFLFKSALFLNPAIVYLCDLFFLIFCLIFIVINYITSLKQTHLLFTRFLECLLLFLVDNVDEERK